MLENLSNKDLERIVKSTKKDLKDFQENAAKELIKRNKQSYEKIIEELQEVLDRHNLNYSIKQIQTFLNEILHIKDKKKTVKVEAKASSENKNINSNISSNINIKSKEEAVNEESQKINTTQTNTAENKRNSQLTAVATSYNNASQNIPSQYKNNSENNSTVNLKENINQIQEKEKNANISTVNLKENINQIQEKEKNANISAKVSSDISADKVIQTAENQNLNSKTGSQSKITQEEDSQIKNANIRYVHRNDLNKVWNGKGIKPTWLMKELKSGFDLNDFDITNPNHPLYAQFQNN